MPERTGDRGRVIVIVSDALSGRSPPLLASRQLANYVGGRLII